MSSFSYKFCELDPIPFRILRACAASVLPTITNVLTISLETGFIPTVLKETIVEPLPKKSTLSPEDFNNFRPVSNLCFVSNIIEKCVVMQLIKYLDAMLHLIIIFSSLVFLKDLFLDRYYIPFIRLHWETLLGLMVSTSTSTLTTHNWLHYV